MKSLMAGDWPLGFTYEKNFSGKYDWRITEKCILDILFEIKVSSEKDAPTNSQIISFGKVGNNSYVSMTLPQAWQF